MRKKKKKITGSDVVIEINGCDLLACTTMDRILFTLLGEVTFGVVTDQDENHLLLKKKKRKKDTIRLSTIYFITASCLSLI